MIKFKIILIVIYFFLSESLLANNLAYIDFNFILNNSNIGKNIIKKLDSINIRNLDTLKKEQSDLNNEKNEIEKINNIISQEELNKKIEIYNEKLRKFAKKQENLSTEFKNTQNSEIDIFIKKINPIIENYMIDNDIDIILKNENIYISKSEYNITNKILNLIDKKLK